ncbi:MAG: DNA-processing protein DprA [Clostridia bacterium]|nr:DNA-processing protein DprA [Clostridia bacterium]
MYDENCLYWIWLAESCGVASKDFARLIGRFENPFEIYRLEGEEISAIDFIGDRLRDALSRKSLEGAYSILRYCKENKVDIVTYGDERYPSRLKMLENPPAVLYCIGKLPDFNNRLCVGVVGTRKISAYGMEAAYKISYELASANVCIVSGMALGVDAVSACGALEAGGDTVAVLGCGIDIVYPKAHTKLRRAIAGRGAVITEYPPSTPPAGRNFPVRNRIISGLCQGVLVIEGNLSSGAMITAKKAVAQGRDLFALPGKINESNSEGPNELIKDGANVALRSEDIILHYDFLYHDTIDYRGLKRSKNRSDFKVGAVEKYGVSSEVYYSAAELAARASERASAPVVNNDRAELASESGGQEYSGQTDNREVSDNSDTVLAALDEVTRRVFNLMPLDRAVSPDEFASAGVGIAEAITSLTMLEISGLVSSLPGGTYIRK